VTDPTGRNPPTPLTNGHLLGGRVRYAQPRDGFRSGIEPVLLAAAVPARAGERVLEGGSGAGAALLCLAARVRGVVGVGVERESGLARIAADNAMANGWPDLTFLAADLTALADRTPFDHACANPPYHAAGGTLSPVPGRESAKRMPDGLLEAWTMAMGRGLRDRGTLTLILPAAALPACLSALSLAACPAWAVLPLWPTPGRAAKLVLVQGVRNGRSPLRLLPGLTLHRAEGGFTAEAEAILRAGAALDLGMGRG
jgi:tRNA1(Val) A37 N6-methylase TrmN6